METKPSKKPPRRRFLDRMWAFARRPELREAPARVICRRAYFEAIRLLLPNRLERTHLSRLRGTDYSFAAPLTEPIGRSVFLYGVYEPVASLLFAQLLEPGDMAIDVGSHYGDFSLLAAHKVGDSGGVLAFEPQGEVRAVLENNLRANHIRNTVVFDCALADRDEDQNLYTSRDPLSSGGASLSARHVGQADDFIKVPVRQLDNLLTDDQMGRVAAIKVDVEGAEPEVFVGASRLIAARSPAIIFEVNGLTVGPHGHDCPAFGVLRSFGYSLYGALRGGDGSVELHELARGQDPSGFTEPWLSLNLVAVNPRSRSFDRLRAKGLLP